MSRAAGALIPDRAEGALGKTGGSQRPQWIRVTCFHLFCAAVLATLTLATNDLCFPDRRKSFFLLSMTSFGDLRKAKSNQNLLRYVDDTLLFLCV